MTTPEGARTNPFLTGPLGPLFLRSAVPIILMMLTNGIQTLIDAWFLGVYVGADALAAVTLMFPVFMLMAALSSLVSTGMSSVLARALGAGDIARARALFTGAHGLALVVCMLVLILFQLWGAGLTARLAGGSAQLAAMGHAYIAIIIWGAPAMFLLGVNGDALRCEGRFRMMMIGTVTVTLANIALTYMLVAVLNYGVVGNAVATVLAQLLALAIIIVYRSVGATALRWRTLRPGDLSRGWGAFLSLGAPQSLSFMGISLIAGAIILSVQKWGGDSYAATVAAYGIITRIMTFAFMPLMGMSMATQTVVGNNFGAGLYARSDGAIRIGLAVAFVYAVLFETAMLLFAGLIGKVFVDDPQTIAEIGRILPITIMFYVLSASLLVLSGYLQAIGDARSAVLLTIGRTYFLTIPLILALPYALGETGIWFAGPVAELLTSLLAVVILWRQWRRHGYRFGLFRSGRQAAPDQPLARDTG